MPEHAPDLESQEYDDHDPEKDQELTTPFGSQSALSESNQDLAKLRLSPEKEKGETPNPD